MDRRTFIKGAVFAASTPVVLNEVKTIDMNEFLGRATPSELLHYHMGAAAEAMNALRPEHQHFAKFDHADGFAAVCQVWEA